MRRCFIVSVCHPNFSAYWYRLFYAPSGVRRGFNSLYRLYRSNSWRKKDPDANSAWWAKSASSGCSSSIRRRALSLSSSSSSSSLFLSGLSLLKLLLCFFLWRWRVIGSPPSGRWRWRCFGLLKLSLSSFFVVPVLTVLLTVNQVFFKIISPRPRISLV